MQEAFICEKKFVMTFSLFLAARHRLAVSSSAFEHHCTASVAYSHFNRLFFHIHTNPATDGFFFSLEMYTEWGQAWTGETGAFEISCSDPTTSTGICPYFDPDGPGPLPVLGGDFMTTGQIIIEQLDADGYVLSVGPVIFSDGTVINPFMMTG